MTETDKVSDIAEQTGSVKDDVYDWVESIVFSVAVIVIIFTFLFRIIGVDGSSMTNTLQNGNRVIVTNINYTPQRYDIIVFSTKAIKSAPLIKRVIAVGGQTVDIDYGTNTVYVDGKAIDSKYIRERMVKRGDITLPAKVPKGYVFVMGDNRNDSLDSRYNMIGMVDTRSIVGKAVLRIFPFNEFGLL